ncbi:sialate O-acetylesterase [Bifidobacterium sp. UTBIF-78]|uniref:sialate O-acetylesterase n=1 Tax=Bifidobacterium sp. UTBIF-78 TaxID=1465263 RepID=UPI0021595818|nr:sialate O-acetylesterase [Bifidobacterium sp. UTBIF-78]
MADNQIQNRIVRVMISTIAVVVIVTVITVSYGYLNLRHNAQAAAATPNALSSVQAETVTLPNYYKENMVFQRNKPVVVRGSTTPKASITVSMDDGKHARSLTTAANQQGLFTASLESLPAQLKPYTLTITSMGNKLFAIRKTYVGDVFVAAGQSNMELNYNQAYGSDSIRQENMQDVITTADLPNTISDSHVFFLTTSHVKSNYDEEAVNLPLLSYNDDGWLPANQSNAENLSYLAQFFAEYLRKDDSNVPIGIIQTAWGGSPIKQHMVGGEIYGTHIAPLKGFNIAAVLWYQGETDAGNPSDVASYSTNFVTLINQYREVFQDSELPFLYVQLARYDENVDTAGIRQAQLDTLHATGTLKNVAMTVSIDSDKGSSELIHPLGKDILAYRMARQWEAMRDKASVPESPLPERAVQTDKEGSMVTISFSGATGKGLRTMSPVYSLDATATHVADDTDDPLQGFEVAGADGKFKSASASIKGDNTVVVTSKEVQNIRQVRYLWRSNPTDSVLLYNGLELPASPFRLGISES